MASSSSFITQAGEAALATVSFFWMAFWAFCLGYAISAMIQVFVTEERMRRTMGESGPASVGLAAFFGFLSSSCSFAALSTSRALFQKGAGLVPALAFLLASTNLVVELGMLIFVFLSWQFVVGEYVGGLLMIGITWALVRLAVPERLVREARAHAGEVAHAGREEPPDWRRLIRSLDGWRRVARRYFMEWRMVWKDVTFGFTVAGLIAALVPAAFFRTLFVGSGAEGGAETWQVVAQTLIGPVAAFFTFIGSMGNIPLAAVLFGSGVSFAGVMAFIFSDLVVFPVLRLSVRYFGWRMALAILAVFLASLATAALIMHAGFAAFDALPAPSTARITQVEPSERFAFDTTFFLNAAFGGLTLLFAGLALSGERKAKAHAEGVGDPVERILLVFAVLSLAWLAAGLALAWLR